MSMSASATEQNCKTVNAPRVLPTLFRVGAEPSLMLTALRGKGLETPLYALSSQQTTCARVQSSALRWSERIADAVKPV